MITKWQLFQAFVNGTHFVGKDALNNVVAGTIDSIQREDGSGHCFNVRVFNRDHVTSTIFVRTID